MTVQNLWEAFGNVPISEGSGGEVILDEPFLDFPAGTHREEIWEYFEAVFHLSVHDLMFPN